MKEWVDDGFVLSTRKHGEHAVILNLLSRDNGRYAGLVRGGAGRRARGIYQAGNLVRARWRARIDEHLGTFTCELREPHASRLLTERLPLVALLSATALLSRLLPEREPCSPVFEEFRILVGSLCAKNMTDYVRWELSLLTQLGYGLDLSRCALTGCTEDLGLVSPRTGRAVSREAGKPWRDRLLVLPAFLVKPIEPPDTRELVEGLRLTGHFLSRCARETAMEDLPQVRAQLIDLFERSTTIGGMD